MGKIYAQDCCLNFTTNISQSYNFNYLGGYIVYKFSLGKRSHPGISLEYLSMEKINAEA